MERRGEECRENVDSADAGRPAAVLADRSEPDRPEAQNEASATIEISDADYRTLHLPCDKLEESGDSDPGH
ncbi:MAG: hypothetical protein KDI33_08700 [Halioglobus sp.]|nr:hypothetical protein [Halioglobus sp.]